MAEATSRFPMVELIQIGEMLAWLQGATAEATFAPSNADPLGVLGRLDHLVDLLNRVQVRASEQLVRDFRSAVAGAVDGEMNARDGGIGESVAALVRDAGADLRRLVAEEALQRTVFVVPPDRDAFAEAFLDETARFFGLRPEHRWPDVRDALEDMEEAAECYAIGRYGGAIIFSLRATEALVKHFYEVMVGDSAKNGATLGYLLSILRLPVVNCGNAVPSTLGVVRKRRNRAMHAGPRPPEAWNAEAARAVITQCARAIEAMGERLAKRGAVEVTG